MALLRYLLNIPCASRQILACVSLVYFGDSILKFLHLGSLQSWLALSSKTLSGDQLWRLFTYWLLPSSLFGLFGFVVIVVLLAPRLERAWSGSELWFFCFITAFGSGLAAIFTRPQTTEYFQETFSVLWAIGGVWAVKYGEQKALPSLGLTIRELFVCLIILLVCCSDLSEFVDRLPVLFGIISGSLFLAVRKYSQRRSALLAKNHQ